MPPLSILYLEDSPIDMELSVALLKRGGFQFEVQPVETEQEFRSAVRTCSHDLILADHALPTFDGFSALAIAREHCPETPFIFVSGAIGEEAAIDAMHRGANDYVLKQRLQRLVPAVQRALSQARDRSARKAAEAERERLLKSEQVARAEAEARARELVQVNTELEQFAYAASHDLQEPLRAVRVYAQMLQRYHSASLDEGGAECIRYIEQGVERMQRLIQDLLTYSRITHDHSHIFQPVQLGQVLERTLQDLQPSLEENQATVEIGPLPTVLGDGERISHVFQNLLANSLKYRSEQPPHIDVSATQTGDAEWTISVEDNGIGFEQCYAEDIFGLFKRLHGSTYPGTGLGLAITRRVIEQHGGRIWAESAPQQGTKFFFTMRSA